MATTVPALPRRRASAAERLRPRPVAREADPRWVRPALLALARSGQFQVQAWARFPARAASPPAAV